LVTNVNIPLHIPRKSHYSLSLSFKVHILTVSIIITCNHLLDKILAFQLNLFGYYIMFFTAGIEEVFLATAMGLIRLTKGTLSSSIKVYDNDSGTPEESNDDSTHLEDSMAHGEPTKSMCC
jgi:hypothetical protein